MKKVSVIISNKDTGALLKTGLRNLEEIKKNYYENMEVIVVDSGSEDNSVKMIQEEYPWVTVVDMVDKGLSASSNFGAEKATGDYLLFLAPDAYPRHRAVAGMVDYMETHTGVGLATPKLYLPKGGLDHDAHRSFPTPWNSFTRLSGLYKLFPKSRIFNAYFMANQDLDEEHEIDACVLGFMLVRKTVFDQIQGFDEDYYRHGLDLDICYRIKESGHKIMYLPEFESGHLKTKVPGSRERLGVETKEKLSTKLTFVKSSTSAMRIFMRKNYHDKYSLPLLWFMVVGTYLLQVQRVVTTTIKHLFT